MPVMSMETLFKKERVVYGDWRIALWRELFQNSTDAIRAHRGNGGRIDISLVTRDDGSVQLVFQDNGHGMTREVLTDVFFAPGETTKGQGDMGGFGRARILTCFSHRGYRIDTNEHWAAGGSLHPDGQNAARSALEYAIGGRDTRCGGCRIELDIDDETEANLRDALHHYLGYCQMDCDVFIDGIAWKDWAHRRQALRELVDAEGRVFATVHANRGAGARHKGSVVVRINGAMMYERRTSASAQVIVEIPVERGKEVLSSTRDDLKWRYESVLQSFLDELAVDRRSAMRERAPETFTVPGALGTLAIRETTAQAAKEKAADKREQAQAGRDVSGGEAVPPPVGEPEAFGHVRRASPATTTVGARDDEVGAPAGDRITRRLPLVPDIHIVMDNPTPAMVRAFKRAWNPETWLDDGGKLRLEDRKVEAGLREILLWKTAVDHAGRAWLKMMEVDHQDLNVGFVFSNGTGARMAGTTALIAPVTAEGRPRHPNLHRRAGFEASWRAFGAEALHEIAHLAVSWHNEDYANVLTQLTAHWDQRAMEKDMKAVMAEVSALVKERKAVLAHYAGKTAEKPSSAEPKARAEELCGQAEERPSNRLAPPARAAAASPAMPWPTVEHPGLRLSRLQAPSIPDLVVLEGGAAYPETARKIGFRHNAAKDIWYCPEEKFHALRFAENGILVMEKKLDVTAIQYDRGRDQALSRVKPAQADADARGAVGHFVQP